MVGAVLSIENVLAKLTVDTAAQWQVVGEVLCELESISGVSPTGDTWQEVVAERLLALGHAVSQGHLYKVRRSFAFAEGTVSLLGLPKECLSRAKIGAVDLAERLYRLDMEAGYDALRACVDQQHPATASEVKRLYESFLENHPERRNPKQVAWLERKNTTAQDKGIAAEGVVASENDDAATGSTFSKSRAGQSVEAEPWLDVLQPVIMRLRDLELILRGRDERIKLLEDENEELRHEVREARQHAQISSEELRDARAQLQWKWR